MSQLQSLQTSRMRKVQPVQEIQTPLAGSPGDVPDAILNQEKDIAVAISKEVQAQVRENIKIKIKRKGALATFQEIGYVSSAFQKILEENDQFKEEQEFGSRLSGQETVALFITLSPEPGSATVYQMHESVKKLCGKKGVESLVWSLENYGLKGEHPHVHALLVLDKLCPSGERGKMKSTITRIFSPYKTKSDAYLDIKPVSQKSLPKKLDYVIGKKYDKEKASKVEQDKLWRKDLGLQDYYLYPEDLKIT